ncbi:MAG: hypothetical protein JXB07_19000 [Anaerolineae bacterium]|nr:hypothetical protein [Anaerolineae bacterium]
MPYVRCTGCDKIIEVAPEFVHDGDEISADGEILNDGSWFYLCDSCEMDSSIECSECGEMSPCFEVTAVGGKLLCSGCYNLMEYQRWWVENESLDDDEESE